MRSKKRISDKSAQRKVARVTRMRKKSRRSQRLIQIKVIVLRVKERAVDI